MFKKFEKLASADKWNLMVPFLGAGLSIVVYFVNGGGWAFYVTLILSVLTYLTAEKLSRLAFEGDMRNHFDLIRRQKDNLEYIGSIAEAMEWVIKNKAGLITVHNTVFTANQLADSHAVDDELRESFDKAIRSALSQGCRWVEICTPEQRGEVDRFAANLDSKQRPSYRAFELDTKLPLIQCMTLQYKDGRKAVLCGWSIASPGMKKAAVYLSSGVDTFEFFETYFTALRGQSAQIHGPSQPVAVADGAAPSLHA